MPGNEKVLNVSSNSDVLKDTESSKDLPWWTPNIDHRITPELHHTLETYSKIAPEDVKTHAYAIREKAWALRPWPCTGLGAFLTPTLSRLSSYAEILQRVKAGASFLDIGCYCGTDLRRLVLDGAPQENLYGTDLVNHWDLGFSLYQDKEKFHVKYIETDILDPSDELKSIGKIDIIAATHFLHNWDWETQVRACVNISAFSKPGSLVVGFQVGTTDMEKRTKWNRENGKKEFTLHDPDTFQKMWDEVGKKTGTEWKSRATMSGWDKLGYLKEETSYLAEDAAIIEFEVTRVR